MMTNGDPQGRIFLSYPELMQNGDPRDGFSFSTLIRIMDFFFLLTTVSVIYFKIILPEVPENLKMRFLMTLLDVLGKITWVKTQVS